MKFLDKIRSGFNKGQVARERLGNLLALSSRINTSVQFINKNILILAH